MNDFNTYKALFVNSLEGVIYVDDQGLILTANPAFLKMFGYTLEEIKGEKIELFIPKSLHHKHVKHRSTYTKKPEKRSMSTRKTLKGCMKNGTEFPVEISLSHYRDSLTDELIILAIVFDVTEKRKHEELERNLLIEKDLVDLKSRFVSMASHEFRTPLSTIKSSTSLIQKYHETNNTEKIDKHALRIKDSISHLIHLLDDVLSISKEEEKGFKIKNKEINIQEFATTICEQMQGIITQGQVIYLKYNGDEVFFIDKKILRTVLTNLISNAIKYSYKVTPINVDITNYNTKEKGLEIKVTDKGIGIPVRDQAQIYERFFRSKNVPNIEGTGLGLSIVKKNLEYLNGTISFTSKPKFKTEFIVTIPLQR